MNNNQAPWPDNLQAPPGGGLSSYDKAGASARRRAQTGIIATYILWGLMPIYWSFLPPMPSYEVVLHRIVWTTLCSFLVVLYRRQLSATLALLGDKKNMAIIACCALMMQGNNLIYIWAVTHNQVVEASLGYFLMPLIQMAFGIIIFKERTSFLQKTAMFLAIAGVSVQVALLGKLPLVALGLALSFGAYTALKKAGSFGSGPGLFWETAIVAPLAAAGIVWFELGGAGHFNTLWPVILLVCTGPLTTFPLLLFSFGAKNLSLVLVGLLQYITPFMILLLGVVWFKERVETGQVISFAFIIAALLIYTFESVRHFRAAEGMARRHRLHKLQKLRKLRKYPYLRGD